MHKIALIIRREYTTRVQKKSFIILTLLMPIMMSALMILPAYFATMDDEEIRTSSSLRWFLALPGKT